MKKPALKKFFDKNGFSLLELVIVIAILGVLAAIAIPNYTAYTDNAKQAADRQTADVAVNAMAMYVAENRLTAATAPASSDAWKTALSTAGLWPASEQVIKSDYYSGGITLSGPDDTGKCTVTLDGATDYVVSK